MHTRIAEFTDTKIITVLQNKDKSKSYSADMSALLVFGPKFAEIMSNQLQAFSRTRALPPIIYAHQFAKWGLCLRELGTNMANYNLEDADDLDELHLIFLEWFFTLNPSANKCKLSTLKRDWTNIGGFINYCQNNRSLPKWDWYQIPFHSNLDLSQSNTRTDSTKLLHQSVQEVDHSKFFSKIIASDSLAISTPEYLIGLQCQLETNLDLLSEFCYKKIDGMISNFEQGILISENADIEVLMQLPIDPGPSDIELPIVKVIVRGGIILTCPYSTALFSPGHPNGLANSLWWIKNRLGGSLNESEVTPNGRLLIRHFRKHGLIELKKYLGTITHENLIYFITLLSVKCSAINNLSSLIDMKASNLKKKGNGFGIAIVDKGRAREYKSNILEPRLNNVMLFLKERTESYRQAMIHDEFSRDALFIGIKSESLIAKPLILRSTSAVGKSFKRFLSTNKETSHLSHTSYSMIRNSQAVIEYIKSGGDWYKTARALGHSINTSMRHYIPQAIKDLLRERKVRQFQNEMLFVAVAFDNRINVLDVVDFSTHEELAMFIKNFIRVESNKTDVLIKVLDKKIAQLNATNQIAPSEQSKSLPIDTAYISLSEIGLAALFRYVECIYDANLSCDALSKVNHITGVAPSFWISLSSKLKLILASPNYENIEHKAIFQSALSRLVGLRSSLTFNIQA